MEFINRYLFWVCIIGGLTSCSNEFIDSASLDESSSITTKALTKSDTILQYESFIYKGSSYEVTYSIVGDSVVNMIADEDTKSLLSYLNSLSGWGTFIYADGSVEYFDNEGELMANLDAIVDKNSKIDANFIDQVSSRGFVPENDACAPDWNGNIGSLYLCDDDGYSGKVRHIFYPSTSPDSVAVPHLKPTYEMNDKTTAFCAYVRSGYYMLLNMYEDDNYRGSFISQIVDGTKDYVMDRGLFSLNTREARDVEFGGVFCPNLKKVVLRRDVSKTWNDRITSIKMKRISKPFAP